MEPNCTRHPTKKAEYFCKQCGFMCDPKEDKNKGHTFVVINGNDLKLIALLQKNEELKATKKNYTRIQCNIQLMIKQQITQISKEQLEIDSEINNMQNIANPTQISEFRNFIKISEKQATDKMDELIEKTCSEITLAMYSLGKTLNEKEYIRLTSENKPTEQMSKLYHRKIAKRVQKREE